MKMTIFFVELIFSIIQDVNINNTKVYLHENIELMILIKTKDTNIFLFKIKIKNLDQVKIIYEMLHQMEVELKDLNNLMDNLDANYPLLKLIVNAIEE